MSTRTTRPAEHSALTYQLPACTGSVWLGLGPAQLTGLALTLLITVGLLLTDAPLPLTVALAAVGAALSAWPFAGRTSAQWLPLLLHHGLRRLVRTDRWHTPLRAETPPEASEPSEYGAVVDLQSAEQTDWAPQPQPQPQPARPVRLATDSGEVAIHEGVAQMAVVHHPRRQTLTVVLATTPTGRFGLLDPTGQDSALQQWGNTLATLLHLPGLRQVQWLVHTGPDAHRPDQPEPDPLLHDQAVLLAAARAQARRHSHLLALTFTCPAGPAVPAARRRAHRDLQAGLAQAHRVAQDTAAALLTADLLSYPLTVTELTWQLRQLTDPTLPGPSLGSHTDTDVGLADTGPGPVAVSGRQAWTYCVTDDTLHRGFAISGWPRTSLRADWLAPLLHHPTVDGTSRTLTVQARPVGQAHAARRARASAAKARLDAADRQRMGFTPASTATLDEVDAEQTEAELVAGYRMADLSGLLTVHAPTPQLLELASVSLRTAAMTHRIELRPLHGQHQSAHHVALPLGLPIRGRS